VKNVLNGSRNQTKKQKAALASQDGFFAFGFTPESHSLTAS